MFHRPRKPEPEPVGPTQVELVPRPIPDNIPPGLKIAAAWSWRLLLVAALVLGLTWLVRYFSAVTVPVAVAVLLTALLTPISRRLQKWGLHAVAATLLSMLVLVIVVVGVLVLFSTQIAREAPALAAGALAGIEQLLQWLAQGPLHIEQSQISGWIGQLGDWLQSEANSIASGAAAVGAGIGHFLAGLAIALVATFFFLYQGDRIGGFLLNFVPRGARPQADRASRFGWNSLVAFMRAQVLVCLVDATGVLIAALILQVPMPWALFALTFVASFVPVVGAVLAGGVAVLLALVAHGWLTAVIMLASVVAVMQVESHFLQPVLLGRAVNIHPLAVILGLAVGATIAGLVGAVMVIPVLAFGVAFVRSIAREETLAAPEATLSKP